MEIAIAIVVAIVFGALGLVMGRARGRATGFLEGRADAETRLGALVSSVERGRVPSGLPAGSAEARLGDALERGWAPREAEREEALREAIGRVSAFMDRNVRAPLSGFGPDADAGELTERIDRALGALQDLEFFISAVDDATARADLASIAQRVSREFASDHGVAVRLRLSDAKVHADVNAAAFMDALYLVLHNAGRFGGGSTVDLTVATTDGRAEVVVRDRGGGFSEEAFRRAFDPFYSTSDEGLGLGLPHARKVIERMGGRIELRNVPDGGAEVKISFPGA